MIETGNLRDRAAIATRLSRWRAVPDLASLRDPAAVANLPLEERRLCRALWSRVDLLIDAGRRTATPDQVSVRD